MNEPTRPLPQAQEPHSSAFWAATKNHEFRYLHCENCDSAVEVALHRFCQRCSHDAVEARVASGRGTVYSYTVVRQSYHPFFRNHAPYAVAYIDLEEGPRIMSNVIGVEDPLSDISIGMAVEVVWEDHEDLAIPLFKPA